jgi:aspartyl/asparaginyl beta-hydroxylase (cupin superfamily)
MLFIIFLIICIIIICIIANINLSEKCCIIPNYSYPSMQSLFDNKNIVINELNTLQKSNKWSKWDATDNKYESTPIFTKMSNTEIISRIKHNENYLNNGKPSWRIYGLILDGHELHENTKLCPDTMKLLKSIPNVINAGFSCLEPSVQTERHKDFNRNFYRVHIPLYIPIGDCYMEINGEKVKWTNYFIFDDTCYHQAFNNTKENRFILIVDIKR